MLLTINMFYVNVLLSFFGMCFLSRNATARTKHEIDDDKSGEKKKQQF